MPDEDAPNASLPPTAVDDVRVANARWWDALVAADEEELDALLPDDFFYSFTQMLYIALRMNTSP